MPESLEDHCRLLVSEEDDSVFLLIVGTGEARAGRRPISVMCVRGVTADADTNMRQMYGCVVNVTTPPGRVGSDTGLIGQTWTLEAETIPPMWTRKTHGIRSILYPLTWCKRTPRRFTWTYALSSALRKHVVCVCARLWPDSLPLLIL